MIEKIISSPDLLLPQHGLWAFLLDNWLAVAIAVMILGFAVDQLLYILRYRPQDKWKAVWNRLCGRPAEEEPEETNPLEDTGMTRRMVEEHTVKPVPKRAPVVGQSRAPQPALGRIPQKTMVKQENVQTDLLHRPVSTAFRDQVEAPFISHGEYHAEDYETTERPEPVPEAPVIVRQVELPDQEPVTRRP